MDTAEWLSFVSVPSDSGQVTPCTDRAMSDKAAVTAPTPQIPTPPASTLLEYTTLISFPDLLYALVIEPGLTNRGAYRDAVFFYVHGHQVLGASENGFKSLLPPKPNKAREDIGPIISLPENSCVLNVLLHTVYHMHCTHYSPSIDILVAAVHAMNKYGIPITKYIAIGTPLYQLILALAPVAPLELYSLAATYDLYDLAVPISSHLLAYPLSNLTDEMAERIGPVYLKRMFFLHLGRIDALKRLLLPPPHPHAPTPDCDFTEQKKLTRAWALASAYLAWDARPDLSTSSMEAALGPLGEHLTCELCQTTLRDRIKQLIIQWSVVKTTI